MQIIANYLPQFHEMKENNEWWGKGYTDWVAVKKSKPLFEGHRQPKVPMHRNYYSLDEIETIRWQAKLAKKYGISAFGIYHYWFNSEMNLLKTPAELLLKDKSINMNFMFLWDNTSWVRSWSAIKRQNAWAPEFDCDREVESEGILARLDYGGPEQWNEHFYYLLPFFKDVRYLKMEGKIVFGFMNPSNDINTIIKMTEYWNTLALREGLPGIIFMTNDTFVSRMRGEHLEKRFRYCSGVPQTGMEWFEDKIKGVIHANLGRPRLYDYDKVWKSILRSSRIAGKETILSGITSFDDTPRRGTNSRIFAGSSPEKFKLYFEKLLRISKDQGKEYVFLSAWNEWGEGMYLEPDEENGYAWLEAVYEAIQKFW